MIFSEDLYDRSIVAYLRRIRTSGWSSFFFLPSASIMIRSNDIEIGLERRTWPSFHLRKSSRDDSPGRFVVILLKRKAEKNAYLILLFFFVECNFMRHGNAAFSSFFPPFLLWDRFVSQDETRRDEREKEKKKETVKETWNERFVRLSLISTQHVSTSFSSRVFLRWALVQEKINQRKNHQQQTPLKVSVK